MNTNSASGLNSLEFSFSFPVKCKTECVKKIAIKICYKDTHTDYIHPVGVVFLMQEMLKRKVTKYNSHRFEHRSFFPL